MASLKSSKLWKDSATAGLAIVGLISAVTTIVGFSLGTIFCNSNWITRLGILIAAYILLVAIVLVAKLLMTKKGITLKIRGITVNIKKGDLFKKSGWKLISFNEYFDTDVDEITIAKNTLNGAFIDSHVNDLAELKKCISDDQRSPLQGQLIAGKGKYKYPLGCIKIYHDYMLLAFTHFNDQSEAHLSQTEYEDCLRIMWKEICRTYANKPVFIPLLGSGITRFDGVSYKSKSDLLKCILCTLKRGDVNLNQPINIILSEDAMKDINLYDFKGEN